jgi:MbtH protein
MTSDRDEDATRYNVVVNPEEQYSIWPSDRELPQGWREAGKSGNKAECLAYIEEVWTDMRPLSLRQAMGGAGAVEAGSPRASRVAKEESAENVPETSNVVRKASMGAGSDSNGAGPSSPRRR